MNRLPSAFCQCYSSVCPSPPPTLPPGDVAFQLLMPVLYQKFFVGARRAFVTSTRFGLACAEERKTKSSGPGTAICLLQQPEPAVGAGQALLCGWELCVCVQAKCRHSSAPLSSAGTILPAVFALLALIQVLKQALPSIYLIPCLLVEVFIHK